jgi:hypothetical protein
MLKHIVTEGDFSDVSDMGANAVRLSLITYQDFENDSIPYTYKENNFQQLDSVIQWAEKHNIYLIISMRQSPGGHNTSPHSGNNGLNQLWGNSNHQHRLSSLWNKIAGRYSHKSIIAGYDLLNEPDAPDSLALNGVYKDIIDSIRSVDINHIVFVEGNSWAQFIDWINPGLDPNMALSIHFYLPADYTTSGIGIYPDTSVGFDKDTLAFAIQQRIKFAQNVQLPCYVGEFGARAGASGHLSYDKDLMGIMDSRSLSWNYYCYKNISGLDDAWGIYYTDSTSQFLQLLSAIVAGSPFFSFTQQRLDSALLSLETNNLFVHQDIKDTLSGLLRIPLGISSLFIQNANNLLIYPNPFGGTVNLQLPASHCQITIFDIRANIVFYKILYSSRETLNLNLPSGIYFYQVKDNDQIISSGKLVVQ